MSADAGTSGDQTLAPGNGFLGDTWVNMRRWLLKSVRNPFIVTSSIVQPLIFLVLFSQVFGQVTDGAIGGPREHQVHQFPPSRHVIQVWLVAAAIPASAWSTTSRRGCSPRRSSRR